MDLSRRRSLASAMLSVSSAAAAAQEWVQQSPFPADSHLYNVYFHDAERGWLMGQDGVFMRTDDGGATWAQHPSFPRHWYQDDAMRNVQFVDPQRGFAGGINIFRTIDGGETWEDLGYHGTAASMVFVSAQVGFIVGNSGLRRTTDGGESFETIASMVSDVAFLDAATGVYATYDGVFRTTDAGATWTQVSTQPLSRVLCITSDVLVGVLNTYGDNAFYRSTDGGATWSFVYADNSYSGSSGVVDLERVDADSLAAVDVSGGIWLSDDAGLTWAEVSDQIGEFFNFSSESWGLHFPTPTTGYAAGGPGLVLKSIDGGRTWEQISNGATISIADIEMHESGLGIGVGQELGVLRTTDFGRTWSPARADTLPYSEFLSVQIIDADTVVACGQGEAWDPGDAPAVFYRSDDGGRTWERRGNGIARTAWAFESVHFIDEDRGWLFGQTLSYPIRPAVYATTDGGLSWAQVDNGAIGFPLEGQMQNAERGWFTSGGALWITDDNWATATMREYPVAFGNVNDFEFVGASGRAGTGWLVGRWGEVLRTESDGQSFEVQSLPGFDISYDLAFDLRALSAQEVVIATYHSDLDGNWGTVYRTVNSGATWDALGRIQSPQNDLAGRIYTLDALAGGSIWAAGSRDGYVWAMNPPGQCRADFNGDGVADTLDVLAFLNAWNAGDPRADFNDDGGIDTLDVLAFLNAWNAGCP